jgi:hypothetical protein
MVLLRQGLNKSQLRLSAGPGKVLFGGARITWPGQARPSTHRNLRELTK